MPSPNITFTSSLIHVEGLNKVLLIDSTDYVESEITLVSRRWIITKADGTSETFIDPTGIFEYPLPKDLVLQVKLAINYDPVDEMLGYQKTKTVMASPVLQDSVYDMQITLIDKINTRCADKELNTFIDTLQKLYFLEVSSRTVVSTDIIKAQQALDAGNRYLEAHNCGA